MTGGGGIIAIGTAIAAIHITTAIVVIRITTVITVISRIIRG
jgi:hypothetical protein